MQSKIFYSAGSGRNYELTVLHDEDQYVPKFIAEDETSGYIADLSTDLGWDSLPEMTQALELEILGCESADTAGN
jgi:hypothetical protein